MTSLERLRVASVYRRFDRSGSIPSLFLRNAERLAEDEHLTVFASAADRAETSADIRFVTVEPAIRGHDRVRYALECSSFARRASREVARRRSEYDVVHAEGFAAYETDLVTVHAVRAAEIEHYFARVELEASAIRRRLARALRPQSHVVMTVERRLFGGASTPYCLCPSQAVKRDLERWHGVPADRIEVLPYGIETTRFQRDPAAGARLRATLGTPSERLVVLFVGSSLERKGLDVCFEGVARSRLTDAEVWVLGGTAAEQRRFEAKPRVLGRPVHFLGWASAEELPAYYSAADVFVLPTRQDSWAIPVAEAMAAGCVVVTSEYSGSCDLIENGASGFVLESSGAAGELAALLDGPLADPAARAAIGARAVGAVAGCDYESFYSRYRSAHWHAFELRLERLSSKQGTRFSHSTPTHG